MKRKSLQHTLDSPSNKSRRLDVELLQRIQEDSMAEGPLLPLQPDASSCTVQTDALNVMPVVDEWHDKAMVLYRPPDSPLSLLKSPSLPELPTIVLNSELIPGIRDHLFWPGKSKTSKLIQDEMVSDRSLEASNNCLAVVPWVAVQPPTCCPPYPQQPTGSVEAMEAEEVQAEMMDIEDCSNGNRVFDVRGVLQEWQQHQQHCIAPQHFQSNSSPVPW